jgi:hypothetical protein
MGLQIEQSRDCIQNNNQKDGNIELAHKTTLAGISFSGGGIRSAIFNLGILQSMANLNILHIFDYISTVSGGGYIGCWLSAWIYRSLEAASNPAFTKKELNRYNLKSLCSKIREDFDLGNNTEDDIQWLNRLIAKPELYKDIRNRKNIKFSDELAEMVKDFELECQYRLIFKKPKKKIDSEKWSKVHINEIKAIKKSRIVKNITAQEDISANKNFQSPNFELLNRLALEEAYPQEVPKYSQRVANIPSEILSKVLMALKTSERSTKDSVKNRVQEKSRHTKNDESESKQINFLRRYSNYLTPLRGFTTDSLTLGVAYAINFSVNLIVLMLILSSILTIPFLVVKCYHWISEFSIQSYIFFITAVLFLIFSLWCAFMAQQKTVEEKWELRLVTGFVVSFLLASASFSIALWRTSFTTYAWWKWSLVTAAVFSIALLLGRCPSGFYILKRKEKQKILEHCKIIGGEFLAALISGLFSGPLFYLAASHMQKWSREMAGLWHVAVWGYIIVLLIFGISTIAYTGVAGRSQAEDLREWTFRLWALVAKYTVAIGALLILGIYGPWVILTAKSPTMKYVGSFLTIGWIITTIGGVLTGKSKWASKEKLRATAKIITVIAPYIFIIGLFLFLSLGLHRLWIKLIIWGKKIGSDRLQFVCDGLERSGYWYQLEKLLDCWWIPLILLIAFSLIALLLSWRAGVNEFSLHAIYGNRLVRAFLGASNLDYSNNSNLSQRDPFTFFNSSDNDVKLGFLSALSNRFISYPGPFPIINTTINLSKNSNLAWQDRKGMSFTFSPLYSGCDLSRSLSETSKQSKTGDNFTYIPSKNYSGKDGVSLGKAMVISGAAASPNMGYYTSLPLAFLMTVFNVRLGWWLGNPIKKNEKLLRSNGPKVGFFYLLKELLAKAGENSRYVYLSDGGHFENLGIYELVKRRCRYIVACDASRDKDLEFNDLGNAIEKCRTDFGIDIMINVNPIRKQNEDNKSIWHCAVGSIRYSAVDANTQDGILFYIKTSLTGDEPLDIMRYASQFPDFPHQSTADQWFDETQFESYRRLGEHIARVAFENAASNDKVIIYDGDSINENNKLASINVERLFYELKKEWYPPIPSLEKAFSLHASGLESIISRLKADDNLRFLDQQLYPSLGKLDKLFPDDEKLKVNFSKSKKECQNERFKKYLPKNEKELRAGFYMCKEMIVFMESVYHDLNLDEYFEHPDNRGWINLFNRWWWSRMFRFTWSVTASTFGARFQTFCEQKMKFKKCKVKVGKDKKGIPKGLQIECSLIKKYLAGEKFFTDYFSNLWEKAENTFGFNYFETELLIDLIKTNLHPCTIYPIFICTEDNPLKDKLTFDFNVGFIIMDSSQTEMYYFRIQNHLRKMGLARESLRVFLSHEFFRQKNISLNLLEPSFEALEVPLKNEKRYFEMLFNTVKNEVEIIHSRR